MSKKKAKEWVLSNTKKEEPSQRPGDMNYMAEGWYEYAVHLESESEALKLVLKGYESWEAELIGSNEAWGHHDEMRRYPHFTETLWDKLMELQEKRNKALNG